MAVQLMLNEMLRNEVPGFSSRPIRTFPHWRAAGTGILIAKPFQPSTVSAVLAAFFFERNASGANGARAGSLAAFEPAKPSMTLREHNAPKLALTGRC